MTFQDFVSDIAQGILTGVILICLVYLAAVARTYYKYRKK